MWRLFFVVWLGVGGLVGEMAMAEDYVDAGGELYFHLHISKDVSKSKTAARMTFIENGHVELRKGGYITINGIPLEGRVKTKPGYLGLFQTGYDYTASLPDAEKYEIVFKRSANHEELRYVMPSRTFYPHLPDKIHLDKDLVIPFEGPPIAENEVVSADATYINRSPPNWGGRFRLKLLAQGNKLVLPALLMPAARKEKVELAVGVIARSDAVERPNEIAYAVTRYAFVEVTD